MSLVLSILVLLFFPFLVAQNTSDGNSHRNTYHFCPPTRCSPEGPDIRFPFRLNNQPIFCGLDGFELSCSNNKTLVHLPSSGDYYVQEIDYLSFEMSVVDVHQHESGCTLQNLSYPNLTNSIFEEYSFPFIITNCSRNISLPYYAIRHIPIDCISDDRNFFYMIPSYTPMDMLPSACSICQKVNISVDWFSSDNDIRSLLTNPNKTIRWEDHYGCAVCEESGVYCSFNITSHTKICCNSTICCDQQNPTCFELHRDQLSDFFLNSDEYSHVHGPHGHGPRVKILVATVASVGGIIFVALVILLVYKFRNSESERETYLKVEKFLEDHKTTLNPTRYTYSDLKKITGKFRHRLGQGGYGSVFRGKFSNGIPVAVKMLEQSIRNGEEFINEVATVGRIHHFNIVRLLGFFAEGGRRALIYEFMPNGSLEKFIFSKAEYKSTRPLSWKKLWNIAIGVARGIEYLHQGCNQRILHFDIKPHNILLDHNFQPKISDFGLAKLCSKEQSIVSMTAARGTAGYIAPELFSRNFGEVSYKSDVFSYGMMLLEMVGCRKNIDVTVENQSQIFFPEWIYNKMSQGKELSLEVEADEDEGIAKKLAIVGLWCIQWNPIERPSMPMVIQMLEDDLQNLEMPPKPFVSSDVENGAN